MATCEAGDDAPLDEARWRVAETADYICGRGFSIVTLQLPDELLGYAARLAPAVQAACEARGHAAQVYVLADTTYNSLSVDEVAAAHVGAHCVAHYGRASLTPLSRLPAFFVFPEQPLNVGAAAACLAGCSLLAGGEDGGSSGGGGAAPPPRALVFLDQPLLHQLPELQAALLAALEQRRGSDGGSAAARLVFPCVPQQHMEPQQPQQEQDEEEQAQRQPAAGCCGGGSCGVQLPEQQPQQQPQQQLEARVPQLAGPCPCAPPGGPLPLQPKPHSGADAPAATPAAAPRAAGAGGEPTGDGDSSSGSLYSLAGYQWRLPAGMPPQACGMVWVGAPDAPALLQLQLTYSRSRWAMLDPGLLPAAPAAGPAGDSSDGASGGSDAYDAASLSASLAEGLPLEISRALRRRYFLVQKARDASVVGILLGTLGAAGYGGAIAALRAAAAAAGKKSYTLLMGKPSPAKLANFPEIEVFVLVADPQGQILDSKDYLAPLITPHEAMLAWAPPEGEEEDGCGWDEGQYRLDFEGVLQKAGAAAAAEPPRRRRAPRYSLLAGGYTGGGGSDSGSGSDGECEEVAGAEAGLPGGSSDGGAGDPSTALAVHAQQALQVSVAPGGRSDLVAPRSAADYLLHKRSWRGVEAPLVGAPEKAVEAAVEGRSGRAAVYVDEPAVAAAPPAQQQEQRQQEPQEQ